MLDSLSDSVLIPINIISLALFVLVLLLLSFENMLYYIEEHTTPEPVTAVLQTRQAGGVTDLLQYSQ